MVSTPSSDGVLVLFLIILDRRSQSALVDLVTRMLQNSFYLLSKLYSRSYRLYAGSLWAYGVGVAEGFPLFGMSTMIMSQTVKTDVMHSWGLSWILCCITMDRWRPSPLPGTPASAGSNSPAPTSQKTA